MNRLIKETTPVFEIIEKYPELINVFNKYNFHCIGCPFASFETIKDIASAHNVDVKKFVNELNKSVKKTKNQ